MRCINTQNTFFASLGVPQLFTRTPAFKECSISQISQLPNILTSSTEESSPSLLSHYKPEEDLAKRVLDRAIHTSETTQISHEDFSYTESNQDEETNIKHLKRKLWELEHEAHSSKLMELPLKKLNKKFCDDDKSISEKNFADRAEFSLDSQDSKKGRITMSQNYKSTIARGFVRIMKNCLKTTENHYYIQLIHEVSQIKYELDLLSLSNEKLALSTVDYVVDMIKEKSQRKKNNKTKARNVKIIDSIFFPKAGDDTFVVLYKRVAFKLLKYFLKDSNFHRWVLDDCKSSEDNKKFLLENLPEIRKVFENPLTYKAGFHK
jgi:hypothetical protein